MSRYNKPINITKKNIALQALILVATVVVLVWFLPRDGRSGLRFDKGRPWPYGQFIAPYDFPIFKSDAQLAEERDSIHRLYEPYLELLAQTGSEQIAAFRSDYRKHDASEFPASYRTFIEGRLRQVFERGIISNSDLQLLQADSIVAVRIYSGTEASTRPLSTLFSQKAAYDFLLANTDSLGYSRLKLQKLNLNNYLEPNLSYDRAKSEAEWQGLVGSLSPSSGMVLAGQSVIDRGEIVDEDAYQKLVSYERHQATKVNATKEKRLQILGQVLYVAVVCLSLLFYFNLFRRDYLSNLRSVTLLWILVISYPLLTSFLVSHTLLTVYLIPYAMLPIFVRVFMDSRTAFLSHVVTVMLCAMSLRYPFEFIATQLVAGITAVYSLRELSTRSQIIRTAILVTFASLVVYFSIDLIHGRTIVGGDSLTRIDWTIYRHIILGGVLLLFSYPLMYLLERLFGFTSNVTLVELSNVNNELLRQLSEVAPGTFQHSMQVANLAAEVAQKIGAKSQLVRTGALYHDIGKMQNPAFFTENQAGGVNPHDKLDNRQSATIILRHIVDGEQLADRHRLPRVIRDFIATHHGTGLVKYFYISYQNAHPEETVDPIPFSYPGPNPQTAEQAILMMADAVEASARSLKEYNEDTISSLVNRIIDSQVAEGFFADCPITFEDIRIAKDVFKEKLKIMYHTRISYPELRKRDEGAGNMVVQALPPQTK
ncbi:MAG: HDIG domain-containing protein [Bacteroidaceae bacterium]|nr:HDIG domain-containing protein [Bacteroidaceae bacterium]